MRTVIHRAEDRGSGETDWLKSRFSFSFADWYEPSHVGFGALRVLNDDVIAPNSGFPLHAHKDMEIITLVTKGTVSHKDSLGNEGKVSTGDVQVMSAGTGVVHSEHNTSSVEPLELFQIWIEPSEQGVTPRYDQQAFDFSHKENQLTHLVGPKGEENGLWIHQHAHLSYAAFTRTSPIRYTLHGPGMGVYLFVCTGAVRVGDHTLGARDATGLSTVKEVVVTTPERATMLVIEVPLALGELSTRH